MGLHYLFSDIFDIYPTDDFINNFIKNDDLLLEKILAHPYLHFNIVYSSLWNFIYKTYPSRKDFIEISKLLGYSYQSNIIFDIQLFEKLINTFLCLKIGMLNYITVDALKSHFLKILTDIKNNNFIVQFIIDKSLFRFHTVDIQIDRNNLIFSLINIRNYRPISLESCDGINPVTNSVNENIQFTTEDNKFMTHLEKVQYVIYKDNHFLLKFIDNTTIYIDSYVPQDVLVILIEQIRKNNNKNPLIFNLDKYDKRFGFNISSLYYNLLPCLSKQHITFSTHKYPRIKSLATNIEWSIYALRNNIITNEDQGYLYCKYIVNDLNLLNVDDVKVEKYIIHDCIHHNCLFNNEKIKIYTKLESKYFDKYQHVNIVDTLSNDVDIIIDLDNTVDHVYHCSIPILNYNSPYLKHMINGIKINKEEEIYEYLDIILKNKEVLEILKKGVKTLGYLFNPKFIETLWKYHLTQTCPVKSKNSQHGVLIYLNFIHKYLIHRLDDIITLHHIDNTINCSVIIDNRPNILSVISTFFTMINLNESWSCHVLTSKNGLEFYKEWLGHFCNIEHCEELDVGNFHIDIYNDILMSRKFWNKFEDYDKCLIFQDDGVILSKGIETFFMYDYVGAPWVESSANHYIRDNINSDLVGNGGLSLRTVKVMSDIVRVFKKEKKILFFNNLNNIPEDVYFSKCCKLINANMPTAAIASRFSSEEIINPHSIGFHKIWSYHHPNNVKMWFNKLLK